MTGRAGFAIRLALGFLILASLLFFFPPAEMWSSIARVSPALWLGCLAAFLAGHVLGAFKWGLLIAHGPGALAFPTLLRFHYAGLFANLFLPSVAGGDVVRAGLAMKSGRDRSVVLRGSVIDRLIDVSALALLAASGGAVAFLGAAGFLPASVLVVAAAVVAMRRGRLAAFALALAIQSLFVAVNAVLGAACGIDVSADVWFFVWPLAKLAAMVPVTQAGLGVREAALAGLLGRFGVGGAEAVGLGLVWETIVFVGGGLGGLVYVSVRRREVDA